MPYDPTTGRYTPEESSVAKRLTGLLQQDSPYIQQARASADRSSNRRGLMNSSIAVEAGESAAIRQALPIASQDAGQAHQTNLQGVGIESSERMQGRGFEHETGLQGRDIESRERMQGTDIESRERLQGRDIASREGMQEAELASLSERQRLGFENSQTLQASDIQARYDLTLQNISAAERQQAGALLASFEASYSNTMASIMQNPDIPASSRQRYMDHAARVRDSNLGLVEQMYSITLDWGAAA